MSLWCLELRAFGVLYDAKYSNVASVDSLAESPAIENHQQHPFFEQCPFSRYNTVCPKSRQKKVAPNVSATFLKMTIFL